MAPISKTLMRDINPCSMAGLLYLGASAGLLPVLIARHEISSIFTMNRTNVLRLSGAIALGGIIGPVLLMYGLRLASASSVSLWLNSELIATVIIGWMFFNDHLGKRGWVGVALALASGIILSVNEGSSGALSALLVGSACICWGFDNHFTALIDGISAVQSTFLKGLCAGTVNTIAGMFMASAPVSPLTMAQALVLGTFSYGVSIVLYILSAQKLGAIRSQIIFSSAPFFGFIFSLTFLSEQLSMLQLISFILMIIAITLMACERHEHRHEHHEMEHTHMHGHDDMHHDHVHDEETSLHEHVHSHDPGVHSHPHWPDLHHRHDHEDDEKK